MTTAPIDRPCPPALDLVAAAHKATRRFLFDTLVQLGALDVTDGDDIDRTLNALDRLLAVLGEPVEPWRPAMQALRHGAWSQRRGVAADLYRALADLVQRQLLRLAHDEQQARARPAGDRVADRLQRLDDDDLRSALHWMQGALTPQELATLLEALHGAAPAGRFHGALAQLSQGLDERRWNQLARALGITQITAAVPATPIPARPMPRPTPMPIPGTRPGATTHPAADAA